MVILTSSIDSDAQLLNSTNAAEQLTTINGMSLPTLAITSGASYHRGYHKIVGFVSFFRSIIQYPPFHSSILFYPPFLRPVTKYLSIQVNDRGYAHSLPKI